MSEAMSAERLAEIRQWADAATQGQMSVVGPALSDGAEDYAIKVNGEIIAECFGRTSETNWEPSQQNAHLFAVVPELLAEVERLQEELGRAYNDGYDTAAQAAYLNRLCYRYRGQLHHIVRDGEQWQRWVAEGHAEMEKRHG